MVVKAEKKKCDSSDSLEIAMTHVVNDTINVTGLKIRTKEQTLLILQNSSTAPAMHQYLRSGPHMHG